MPAPALFNGEAFDLLHHRKKSLAWKQQAQLHFFLHRNHQPIMQQPINRILRINRMGSGKGWEWRHECEAGNSLLAIFEQLPPAIFLDL